MKNLFIKKYLILLFIPIAFLGGHYMAHPQTKVITKTVTKTYTGVTAQPVTVPTFGVGDTQTDNGLQITLISTGKGSAMSLPNDSTVMNVNLRLSNQSDNPLSFDPVKGVVYTQIGKDASTGQYIQARTYGCNNGPGGTIVIAPNETVSRCVEFFVPNGVLVDTFFYDNLKWYL